MTTSTNQLRELIEARCRVFSVGGYLSATPEGLTEDIYESVAPLVEGQSAAHDALVATLREQYEARIAELEAMLVDREPDDLPDLGWGE